jgi:broad specificity phosphatase PhoE
MSPRTRPDQIRSWSCVRAACAIDVVVDLELGAGAHTGARSEIEPMILVRHSIPEKQFAIPSFEWPLSGEGRTRSHELAIDLARFEPAAVFSSPEPKAAETASILAQQFGLEIRVVPELAEHDRTGVPYFSTQTEFETKIRQFFLKPSSCVFGRESANDALTRFEHGIRQVKAQAQSHARPLVVTHGTVMSLYIAKRMQLDAWTIWSRLSLPCYVLGP